MDGILPAKVSKRGHWLHISKIIEVAAQLRVRWTCCDALIIRTSIISKSIPKIKIVVVEKYPRWSSETMIEQTGTEIGSRDMPWYG
ncbi:uncharacterized protein PHALS_13364 [Plasmopara halstedii]|uniref:Uncharacterized protein n=1 Tax=Plasmopara halstedii TaxID=4781 RepID=A0A0P1APS8_PLAHL|nr:uncharacterized protein PHALS_13364 [Plasmopara halstedii]CEG43150.1 hypothetical protein PHALS_13364 [Plasmopara halstedii]|eukprot:XP_024579519.1 hypothetical protein PHALS_13364 [Plasmopara halstedii]